MEGKEKQSIENNLGGNCVSCSRAYNEEGQKKIKGVIKKNDYEEAFYIPGVILLCITISLHKFRLKTNSKVHCSRT